MNYQRMKRREPQVHADDWLMTYADMITLLLCFFAIFLSISVAKKDTTQKTAAPAVVAQALTATPLPGAAQSYPLAEIMAATPVTAPVNTPVNPLEATIASLRSATQSVPLELQPAKDLQPESQYAANAAWADRRDVSDTHAEAAAVTPPPADAVTADATLSDADTL